MKNSRIWLSPPHMGPNEFGFVKDAFESNWIAPMGENINVFENQIAEKLSVEFAVCLSSGTAALHLSLITLGIGTGDIVLCQDLTFAATAFAVTYTGAKPVFIDSDSETWNMDPNCLREAIITFKKRNKRIGAIIPVHLYGMPAQMGDIMDIANEFGIPVIEDAAEALGSTFKDIPLGSMGKSGILSFNGNKIITTSGGGAFVTQDRELAYHVKLLATQAREPFIHYEHNKIGYNYRMSNIVAGIGRGQMMVLDDRVNKRRVNFKRYKAFFDDWNTKGLYFTYQNEPEGFFSNRWLTAVIVDPAKNNNMSCNTLLLALENQDIEARPTWKPLHMQPVFSGSHFIGNGTSNKIFEQGICLPSGSNLTDNDFDRIFNCLEQLFKRYL